MRIESTVGVSGDSTFDLFRGLECSLHRIISAYLFEPQMIALSRSGLSETRDDFDFSAGGSREGVSL